MEGPHKVMLEEFRWSRDYRDSRLMEVSFLQWMIRILGSGLRAGWGIKGVQRWCWGIIDGVIIRKMREALRMP